MAMNNISKAQKRLQMIQKQLSRPSMSSISNSSKPLSTPSRSPSPSSGPTPCTDINENITVQSGSGRISIHHNFGIIINSYTSVAVSPYNNDYKTTDINNDNLDNAASIGSPHHYPTPKAVDHDIAIQEQPEGTPEDEGIIS